MKQTEKQELKESALTIGNWDDFHEDFRSLKGFAGVLFEAALKDDVFECYTVADDFRATLKEIRTRGEMLEAKVDRIFYELKEKNFLEDGKGGDES
jgi:hypothetical protein